MACRRWEQRGQRNFQQIHHHKRDLSFLLFAETTTQTKNSTIMIDGFELALEFNAASYTLIALLVAVVVLPLMLVKDPDIHPYALCRQSTVAPFVPFFLIFDRELF